jgi:hypothetical protein
MAWIIRVALCAVILVTFALVASSDSTDTPDWAIAPCDWWSGPTAHAIPAFTRLDVCIQDDGQLSFDQN